MDLDFYSLNDANYFVNIYLIHFVETTLVIHLCFLIDVGVKHRVDRVGSPYSFLIVCCMQRFVFYCVDIYCSKIVVAAIIFYELLFE